MYDLNEYEAKHRDEIMARLGAHHGKLYRVDRFGELVRDGADQLIQVDFEVLRGKRYCIDKDGVLWRYAGKGESKMVDGSPGGAPRRNAVVEMWTGHWIKVTGPDGKPTYAKHLIMCPVERGVNEHPGMSHIDWYKSQKGFKNPFDPPDAPTEKQIRVLGAKAEESHYAIYAKMDALAEEHGLDPEVLREDAEQLPDDDEPEATPKPKRKKAARKRPNKRTNRPAAHVEGDLPTAQEIANAS